MRSEWDRFQAGKKVSGRNSKLKTLEDEIFMVLIFYRFYVTEEFLGYLFNLDKSNICRHLKRIEPMLAKCIKIEKRQHLSQNELEEILIDATEIAIQRPRKDQRKFYSGKKKKHTMKIEIQTDTKGKILNISKCYGGRTHDFKMRKLEGPPPRNATIFVDSGYQGLQKLHANTVLPYKRRRKFP